ncbi:Eco57I restriction-modification methylase domain-containing protein [Nannocystaceae bacterium ST9]
MVEVEIAEALALLQRVGERERVAAGADDRLAMLLRLVFALHTEPGRRLDVDAWPRLLARAGEVRFAAEHGRALASCRFTRDEQQRLLALLVGVAALEVERLGGIYEASMGAARRKTGSHYTPRSLTEPIVREALAPRLAALGREPGSAQLLGLRVCDPAMGSGAFLLEVVRALADAVLAAWIREGERAASLARARRAVAQTCVFGVDKNPRAVELARLSLCWLVDDRSLAWTAFDAQLREGDSLLGVEREQLASFHWTPGEPSISPALAEASPELARAVGDLLLVAFFAADKPAARERLRVGLREAVIAWLDSGEPELPEALAELRRRLHDRLGRPFHWPLEFPARFDVIVGNPPFLAGKQISASAGETYLAWLKTLHPGAEGNADLSAHFLRRADTLLAERGTIGLIATNTIGQADTRAAGLKVLLGERGYVIHAARPDVAWPGGDAAVTVSIVHLARGLPTCERSRRDSRLRLGHERPDPRPLASNAGLCWQGSFVLGLGFVLSPDQRDALVGEDARNAERIAPYQGGEEINTNPDQGFDRHVINFGTMELAEAEAWPGLLAIVRERVKPERDRLKDNPDGRRYKRRWWLFGRPATALADALAGRERVIVHSQVSKHLVFARVPADRVFAHTLCVHLLAHASYWACLQSRIHEHWARLFSSSMKTDLRYSIADCFATFPFPRADPRAVIPELEALGEALEQTRAAIGRASGRGLTKLYNRLKDPSCRDPAIDELRAGHRELDRAVLRAYGWSDLEVPDYPAIDERFAAELLERLFALNLDRSR